MKVVKFSSVHGNNVGDTIISLVIEREMARRGIAVESYDWMFRGVGDFIRQGSGQPSFLQKISYYLQLYAPDIFQLLKLMSYWFRGDDRRYLSVIQEADHVIIGGGNLLMDKHGSDYSFRAANIMRIAGQKTLVIGVGAGPFRQKWSLSYLKRHLSSCSYIWVRDSVSSNSLEYDSSEEVIVAPDPAFLISNYFKIDSRSRKKFVGINLLRDLDGVQLQILANQLTAFCRKNDLVVKVICTAFPFDREIGEIFLNMLSTDLSEGSSIVELSDKEVEFEKAFSQMAYFVGSRMHSIIFAASYEIPVVGILWDRKVEGVLRWLYGDEWDRFCLDGRSSTFSGDVGRAFDSLERFMPRRRYSEILAKIKGRVELQFDAVLGHMSCGKVSE